MFGVTSMTHCTIFGRFTTVYLSCCLDHDVKSRIMGCCASEVDAENKQINKGLNNDLKKDKYVKKLLFLGSGGSGKSTIFKSWRTIYGEGFKDKDRLQFKDHIYAQIIEQMNAIIESYEELKEENYDEFGHLQLSTAGQEAAQYIDYLRVEMDVDENVAKNIEILWKESAVREIFEHRAALRLDDSSSYFFDEVRRIAKKSYIPTDKVKSKVYS